MSSAALGSKPVMLPDKFEGTTSCAHYLIHFERISMVNKWSETERAMFLVAHLKRAAQEALTGLTPEAHMEFSSILEHFA